MTGFSEASSTQPGSSLTTADAPPSPPTLARRLAMTRKQRIGLPILVLIPLLGLFGVFGERRGETHATSKRIAVAVRYPERSRYRQSMSLEIDVQNLSDHRLDTVRVWLDTAYMTRFADVRITPPPRDAFIVDVVGVAPGETRLVSAELSGDAYGRHRGRVVVSAADDTVSVPISSFVFP
jgi:hypothetical protein